MQRNKKVLLFSLLCSGFSVRQQRRHPRRSNRVHFQFDLKLEELVHQTDIKFIRFRCVICLLHVGCRRCLQYSYIPIDNLRLCEFEGFSVSYCMLKFGQNQIPDKKNNNKREKNWNEWWCFRFICAGCSSLFYFEYFLVFRVYIRWVSAHNIRCIKFLARPESCERLHTFDFYSFFTLFRLIVCLGFVAMSVRFIATFSSVDYKITPRNDKCDCIIQVLELMFSDFSHIYLEERGKNRHLVIKNGFEPQLDFQFVTSLSRDMVE